MLALQRLADISQIAPVRWPQCPPSENEATRISPQRPRMVAAALPRHGHPTPRLLRGDCGIVSALRLSDCCLRWKPRSCQERPRPTGTGRSGVAHHAGTNLDQLSASRRERPPRPLPARLWPRWHSLAAPAGLRLFTVSVRIADLQVCHR